MTATPTEQPALPTRELVRRLLLPVPFNYRLAQAARGDIDREAASRLESLDAVLREIVSSLPSSIRVLDPAVEARAKQLLDIK